MVDLKSDSEVTRQAHEELLQQVRTLSDQLAAVTAREAELRLLLERDTELELLLDRLDRTIDKSRNVPDITAAIDAAQLHLDPFPYTVIDNLFPKQLYDSLLRGLPPAPLFKGKVPGKEHLAVPFTLAPAYSQRVWGYVATNLVPHVIAPRIVEKFRAPIDEWIVRNWPGLDPASVTLHGSDGRIMLRRRGYRIMPHRDPKWSFITCILYLARPEDGDAWGTQLYAVENDQEARSAAPYWIDETQCRLAADVNFRPNRLLVFLNSVGAHGAFIPADAEPADLERYIYQFRVGPPLDTITMLKSHMPPEQQALWTGQSRIDY